MNKKFVFFGTDSFVVPPFEALLALPYQCVGVVTAPDRLGRKKELIPSPIKAAAEKHGIKVFTPQKLRDFFETYKELAPDFCIVASYGKIIPQSFIDLPKFGILNIHPSLLPRHRGPSPVPGTILANDAKTGVAIMKIDAGVDTGPILSQDEVILSGKETSSELLDHLFVIGAKLLVATLPDYLDGKIVPKPQDHSRATHTKFYKKDDGKVNFSESSSIIERQVRALNPWPGTFATLDGHMVKILQAQIGPTLKKEVAPGTIVIENGSFLVAAGEKSTLQIMRLQPESKKPQSADEFLRGYQAEDKKFT